MRRELVHASRNAPSSVWFTEPDLADWSMHCSFRVSMACGEPMSSALLSEERERDTALVKGLVRSARSVIDESRRGEDSDVVFIGWNLLAMAICLERWMVRQPSLASDDRRLARRLRSLSCEGAQLVSSEEIADYANRAMIAAQNVLYGR